MKNTKKGVRKKAGIFLLTVCLAMGIVPPDFGAMPVLAAAQTNNTKAKKDKKDKKWIQIKNKWYYYDKKDRLFKKNGTLVKNKVLTINGNKYYFGSNGVSVKNKLVTINNNKYYAGKNGALVKDKLVTINDNKYYFGSSGALVKDKLITIGNNRYYFGSSGALVKDKILTLNNNKYYAGSDGALVKNKLVTINNNSYYFGDNGVLIKDKLLTLDNNKYYAGNDGALVRDKLVTIDENTYYFGSNGVMLKNTWKVIKNQYYYFGTDGACKKNGWYTVKAAGKDEYMSFYFNSQGVFVKNADTLKKIDQDLVKKMDAVIAQEKITEETNAETAIETLFCLVRDQYGYDSMSARGFKPESAAKDWEYTFAKQMLTNKKGSCYHYAAALAFLVKRATGLPVRIGTGTARVYRKDNAQFHGWVEIEIGGAWYIYDPIVAKNAANRDKSLTYPLYKLPYETAKKYYTAKKYFNVNI